MFKVYNKNIRTTSMTSFCCFYYYLYTHFTPFSSVSFVDFESVNDSWVDHGNNLNVTTEQINMILNYHKRTRSGGYEKKSSKNRSMYFDSSFIVS